jgi:hypothetical protein
MENIEYFKKTIVYLSGSKNKSEKKISLKKEEFNTFLTKMIL